MINKRKVFLLINPKIINDANFIAKIKNYNISKHDYFIFTNKIKDINSFWKQIINNNKNIFFVSKYYNTLFKNKLFIKIKKAFIIVNKKFNKKIKNKRIFYINVKQINPTKRISFKVTNIEKMIFHYIENHLPKNLPIILIGNDPKDWKFLNKEKNSEIIPIKNKNFVIKI